MLRRRNAGPTIVSCSGEAVANRLTAVRLIVAPEGRCLDAKAGSCDETLVRELAKAHGWWRRIESGHVKSITDLAEQRA